MIDDDTSDHSSIVQAPSVKQLFNRVRWLGRSFIQCCSDTIDHIHHSLQLARISRFWRTSTKSTVKHKSTLYCALCCCNAS